MPESKATPTEPGVASVEQHPLGHRWTLWYDNPNCTQRITMYGQTLKPVLTFQSVEEFWCLFDNIRSPSKLQTNATYVSHSCPFIHHRV